MDQVSLALAKLSVVRKFFAEKLKEPRSRYFDPPIIAEQYEIFSRQTAVLRECLPDIFGDLPQRPEPKSSGTSDYDGRGYVERPYLEAIARDIEYIFEVESKSNISESTAKLSSPRRVFISHGRSEDWRAVQAHIERDLRIPTLELAQEPNRGRTVLQKLSEESDRCNFAVIIMTGDDQIPGDAPRARQNVMHEIGFFQGKFGLPNACLLYEEGTDIPSNIHGLVYVPFSKGNVSASFSTLDRELRDAFNSQTVD